MSDEALVRVEGVSKKFCRSLKRSLWYGVQDIAIDLNPLGGRDLEIRSQRSGDATLASGLRKGEFWAVSDVSFQLRRGECLGLIGRNGAGKTTLLKMLNGLIKPDSGRIEMRGRVGALIALGAGFNPILTGRENIYVNGSVLGLSKRQIDGKVEEIIDFAEIREFIDTPVQSYSSGMQVRLGFAVATTIEPEVLLLDEVLAVGDAGFRHKCYRRIGQLQQRCAVVFVSHSMDFVAQICDQVLHMRQGFGRIHHDVMQGISAYEAETERASATVGRGQRALYSPIRDAELRLSRTTIEYGDQIDVHLFLETEKPFREPVVGLAIRTEAEQAVAIWNTAQHGVRVEIPAGRSELRFPIGPLWLLPGKYYCSISVREQGSAEHALWFHNQAEFTMTGSGTPMGEVSVLLPYRGHALRPAASR